MESPPALGLHLTEQARKNIAKNKSFPSIARGLERLASVWCIAYVCHNPYLCKQLTCCGRHILFQDDTEKLCRFACKQTELTKESEESLPIVAYSL